MDFKINLEPTTLRFLLKHSCLGFFLYVIWLIYNTKLEQTFFKNIFGFYLALLTYTINKSIFEQWQTNKNATKKEKEKKKIYCIFYTYQVTGLLINI